MGANTKKESQYLGGGTGSNNTGTGTRGLYNPSWLEIHQTNLIEFITISTIRKCNKILVIELVMQDKDSTVILHQYSWHVWNWW